VDGAFVNGLLCWQRKTFGDKRCKNFVKLILRTAGVCSRVIWQIRTFGGTFFHLHGTVLWRHIALVRCVFGTLQTKLTNIYCITTEEDVRRRSVKLQVSENNLEQNDFVMTEQFTSASQLVRGTEEQNATCRMLGFWWIALHKHTLRVHYKDQFYLGK